MAERNLGVRNVRVADFIPLSLPKKGSRVQGAGLDLLVLA